jgi:hypothetical protein
MSTVAKRLGVLALGLGAVLVVGPSASAQPTTVKLAPSPQRIFPVNPNPEIAPGVKLAQYAYNTAVLGKVYSQIPPYLLGYNPYPQAVNYGPVYNPSMFNPSMYNPYAPSYYGTAAAGSMYGGYSGGYGGSPYAGGYSAGGVDPLTGLPIGGYSSGYNNPSYWNPYAGGYQYGTAAMIDSYGKFGISIEQAKILAEQARQARLDTRKKLIDTLAYIRANEYTFTQEQADIAKRLVQRVRQTPTQTEIITGKSQNILLDDLAKFTGPGMKGTATVTLDEDMLRMLNVAGVGSAGNIGLLRNNGNFDWPAAFEDKELISDKERQEIGVQTKELYEQAANGKPNANTIKDLETTLKNLRTKLGKRVDSIPTGNYLEGFRFLDDFDAALVALRKGDVALNLDFQQKFAKGGRTAQELVQYMTSKGLRFAPVRPGDERAYAALQTALAAYSLAINSQVAAAGKE